MKRRRVVIAGLALAVLTVLGGAAAHAAGRTPAEATETAAAQVEVRPGAGAEPVAVAHDDGGTDVAGGGTARTTGSGRECPAPGAGGRSVESLEVRDGKIYHNGKEVGRVHGDGTAPLTVSVEDGEIRVGKDTEPPAGATVTRGTGRGNGVGGPAVACAKTR
jgi:hypothetical protein